MSAQSAERNLLFGFMALQLNFIPREELIAAVSVWLTDKSRSLEDIFRERESLAEDEQELLAALVRKHLQKHGNNAEQSLAALSTVGELHGALKTLGDPDLEASLRHVAEAQTVKETDPYATLPLEPRTVEKVRFRILRPHAEGGLGQVFVAKDEELNREVALKEIKFHRCDDPASRSRFVLEAEITGGLEHPGIVPVYGLGQYSDGRPFYAMRFIRGDSLKEAVERFHKAGRFDSVEFRQLLGRFIDVCNAIEYAHSRGVLHRDLKPGNIMLGKYGETLVVDWGLAKAQERDERHQESGENTLQPRSGNHSSATQIGSAIGTPAFMSPEQAAGRLDRIGPLSDVYSLGATLYSVLTGQLAFPTGDTGEVLRKVQAGDVLRPRALLPAVPQPLEAICLKAMALRPADRYSSAQALADDLERYLADEPTRAHTEPLGLRARRWIRKHPRFVAAAAAALLVGITSSVLIASVVADRNRQLTVANSAERAAKEQAVAATAAQSVARLQAEKSATAEKAAKEMAQEREAETKAVLDFVESRVFAAARPEGQDGGLGRDVPLRVAVAAALQYVDGSFASQPLIESRLRSTLGNSFLFLGEAQTAVEQHEAARNLFTRHHGADHPDTLTSMQNLANSYSDLGRHDAALKLREETLASRKDMLGADHPDTLASMNNLANSYWALGRQAEALQLREQTFALRKATPGAETPELMASMNNLALSYSELGRKDEALKLYEETLALRKAHLGAHHPDTLMSMNNLAEGYARVGRYAEGLTLNQETLALRKAKLGAEHPDTLASMNNLANSYADLGRHPEALQLREETLALRKTKLGPDHPNTLFSMWVLASSLVQLNRGTEAVPIIDDFLERSAGKALDPRLVPAVLELRLRHFEKLRDPSGCRATAELWEKLNRTDAGSLYNAACFRAISAAVIRAADPSASAAEQANAEAKAAIEWLRKAVAAGYKNAAHVAKDSDLDSLRNRDDFKQLLATLEASQKKESP